MKKFFWFCLILAQSGWLNAQAPGCPSIEASADPTFNVDDTVLCAPGNVTMSAEVFHVGYTNSYVVSSIPYAPPYPYTSGTAISASVDDEYLQIVDLPFDFCFFGQSYNQLVVGTNGIITFDLSYANTYCPWSFSATLPNASLPKNAILGAYHDIDPGVCGNFRYGVVGSWPCRSFIMNFDQVCQFSCNSIKSTLQVVLYEGTNVIEVHILNKPTCSTWNSGNCVIGVQNAAGTVAYVPPGRNTGSWSTANEAWRFTPGGGSAYSLAWFNNGTFLSYNPTITVPVSQTSTYYATVYYEQCDGTTFDFSDTIHVYVGSTDTKIITSDSVLCTGESTTITATGALEYVWDDGSTIPTKTITPTASGYYSVTGFFMGKCETVDSIYIDVVPVPTIAVSASSNVVCTGDSVTLSVLGNAVAYLWSNGRTEPSFTIAQTATATYTVTGTNIAGCISTASVLVNVGNTDVNIATTDSVLCAGESTTLTGSGSNNFLWSTSEVTPQIIVTPLTSGYYSLSGNFMGSCETTDSIYITVNPIPIVSAIASPAAVCEGESSTISVSGADSFLWSNALVSSSFVASPATTTTYTVTGTSNGCSSTASVTLTIDKIPQITSAITPLEGCAPLLIHFDAVIDPLPASYSWSISDGYTSTAASFDYAIMNAGTFDVALNVQTAAGCVNSISWPASINTYPMPVAGFTADSFIVNLGSQVNFTDLSSGGTKYFWNFDDHTSTMNFSIDQNPSHIFSHPGDFMVIQEVKTDYGCSDTSMMRFHVFLDIAFYVPNAFSPYNQDGVNDVFRPFGIGLGTETNSYSMLIFDRWGNQVFESSAIENGWDGNYKGRVVSEGVYSYIIRVQYGDGLWHVFSGQLTIFH